MVSRTAAMAVTKSSKNSGTKKVFSVPVGKLRIKFATPGRNGSNSGSGSVSLQRHKLLLRNNRELARSLSLQKERYRMLMTENLNLKTSLHECELKVLRLEKQLSDCKKSESTYRETLMSHLRNAIRHSVLLTGSLTHAVGVEERIPGSEDSNPHEGLVSHETSGSLDSNPLQIPILQTPVIQPLKHRVNPMIGGHTIRYPTISLKRVVLDSEPKAAEERETSNEEETVERVEDVSQTEESSEELREGFLTRVEEEDEVGMNEDDATEEVESDKEDSIRRKIVSFRSSLKEKDSRRSEGETAETSGLRGSPGSNQMEVHGVENIESHEKGAPKCYQPFNRSGKTLKSANLRNLTPFVALTDVGKLMQNSTSINIVTMSLVDPKSKSIEIDSGLTQLTSENVKDNCSKELLAKINITRESGECENSQQSTDNDTEKRGAGDNKISGRGSKDIHVSEVKIKTSNFSVDDPLEGTSWMYLNYFPEKKGKRKRKGSHSLAKRVCEEVVDRDEIDKRIVRQPSNQEDMQVSNSETVDHVVEDAANFFCVPGYQQKNMSESNTGKMSKCDRDIDCDVDSISGALMNNLIAQSTPMHKGKQTQCCPDILSMTGSLESSCNSSSDDTHSSLISSLNDGSSQSANEEGEKSLCKTLNDSKLNRNAFVTVRVRRLALSDLSPVNNLTGFDGACVADNCSNLQAIKKNISTVIHSSGDFLRSLDSSTVYSYATDCDSKSVEIENCDASTNMGGNSGRPRRRAAPKELKEPPLKSKLRREANVPNKKRVKL